MWPYHLYVWPCLAHKQLLYSWDVDYTRCAQGIQYAQAHTNMGHKSVDEWAVNTCPWGMINRSYAEVVSSYITIYLPLSAQFVPACISL